MIIFRNDATQSMILTIYGLFDGTSGEQHYSKSLRIASLSED